MVEAYIKKKRFEKLVNPYIDHSKKLIWLDLLDPTRDELKALSSKLGIAYGDLIVSLDPLERPRVEKSKNYSYVIFNAPLDKGHVYTGTLGIYVKKNYIITIHRNELKSVTELHENIYKTNVRDIYGFLHFILERVINNFEAELDKIEDFIDAIETEVLKRADKDYADAVFPLKRTLIYFRKALKYNVEVLKCLRHGELFRLRDSLFEDLYQDARQLIDEEAISRERLTEIVNTHLNAMSNELNKVMKSFTIMATLIMLPTLITGLYGMNFQFMPELQWQYGYIFALGLMLVSIMIMLLFFKKKKWL
ncbi:magnesium/cobalt transporter CorA [Candidatus Woesearchaeota archaeon]|jgi:magnesium transporter|nr:magnesium/cobalt transporter CorA [Candidatus Woesearchaeota archaeon]MBT5272235.1 magnesium/cobalt transporter CorA [Candidatus Woesearchaeota archaeon]MBT6040531.1 magnesium/cobalt transporter CorA [Candidatus Woesearchaeota archaeon]MBT6336507.1 magnesium/cobalt transporter CorA [Candidatus Woesearchaeota archaeon]MBT7927397.1 magnesium/cobalt transporter CorA [Candidatus Woesearchaeota archaeon]